MDIRKDSDSSEAIAQDSVSNKLKKDLDLERCDQMLNGKEKFNGLEEEPVKEIAQNRIESPYTNPECSINTEIDENDTVIKPGDIFNSDKWQKVLPRGKKNRQMNANKQNYMKTKESNETSFFQNRNRANLSSTEHRGVRPDKSNYQQRRISNTSVRKAECLPQSKNDYPNRIKNARNTCEYSNNFPNVRENRRLALNEECVENTVVETKLEKALEVLTISSKVPVKHLSGKNSTGSNFKNEGAFPKKTAQTQRSTLVDSTIDSVKHGKEQNLHYQNKKHALKNKNVKINKSETSVLKDAIISINASSSEASKDATVSLTTPCVHVESPIPRNRKNCKKIGEGEINLKKQKQKLKADSANVEKPNIAGEEYQRNDNLHFAEEVSMDRNEHEQTYYRLHNDPYSPLSYAVFTHPSEFQKQLSGSQATEIPNQHFDNEIPHDNFQGFSNMNYDQNTYNHEPIAGTVSENIANGSQNVFACYNNVYNTELSHAQNEPVFHPWSIGGATYYFKYPPFYQKNECYITSLQQSALERYNPYINSYIVPSMNSQGIQQYDVDGTHYFIYNPEHVQKENIYNKDDTA